MPGIAGLIGQGTPEQRRVDLLRMVRAMMHESSYSSGTYIHEKLGLWLGWVAHDGSFSDGMPLWNEKRDVGLIFSGEDYTDLAEIRKLRVLGHNCDPGNASYLVHLYEELGPTFIQHLNGSFVGVIVDLRQDRIILFNDRYGLNRIYFFEDNGALHFSSEAKSLLDRLPRLRQIDPRGLGELFACGCVLQNRTLFPGLSLIPGGSLWTFSLGRTAKRSFYFRPDDWAGQNKLSSREYYDILKETWQRILPRYLLGKQDLAASLTGGKDSRMIMAWSRLPPGDLPCYTFGGPYRDCRDVKLARLVAKVCGQPHQVISIDKTFFSEFPALAEKTVYLTDGVMDVSGAPDLYVNRLARQIAPVRLTGNYGQEILQSYIAFRPRPMNESILQQDFYPYLDEAARTYRDEVNAHPLTFVAFKQVPWYHYSRLSLELSQLTLRSPFLDKDVVALAYRAPAEPDPHAMVQLKLIAEGNPALAQLPTDRGFRYQPVPLFTTASRLFQGFTKKAEYAYDYGMPHWLARLDHVFQVFHPERVFLGRHKFVHFRTWYRNELSEYVKDILLDRRTLSRPYINRQNLEKIVLAHVKGVGNHTSEIHQVLTGELIHRQFAD